MPRKRRLASRPHAHAIRTAGIRPEFRALVRREIAEADRAARELVELHTPLSAIIKQQPAPQQQPQRQHQPPAPTPQLERKEPGGRCVGCGAAYREETEGCYVCRARHEARQRTHRQALALRHDELLPRALVPDATPKTPLRQLERMRRIVLAKLSTAAAIRTLTEVDRHRHNPQLLGSYRNYNRLSSAERDSLIAGLYRRGSSIEDIAILSGYKVASVRVYLSAMFTRGEIERRAA